MVAAMDAVGVDGAILISPFSLYGYDPSYILGVYDQHPGKFGLVRPFDPTSDTIDDDVAQWTSTPGVVGCRVMLSNQDYEADHPGLNAIFAACARAGVPVNVMAAGKLPLLTELARRNPDTSVIIDHVGLAQPFVPPPPAEPFVDLPNEKARAFLIGLHREIDSYDRSMTEVGCHWTVNSEKFEPPDTPQNCPADR